MSSFKSPNDIKLLREAGKKLASAFALVKTKVAPGVTPLELDRFIHQHILDLGATPSFLHYEGYPAASCISRNEQVIHAIPDEQPLKEGDIVTVDVGLWYQGVCVDAAETYAVGLVSEAEERLMVVTREALAAGVHQARPGNRIGAISHAIEQIAIRENLGVIRHFTGHGVGRAVHEEPSIPNWGKPSDGPKIRVGMVLAIEPMFTLGGDEVETLSDGWTVVTSDGSRSAQYEHTVLITPKGPEIIV